MFVVRVQARLVFVDAVVVAGRSVDHIGVINFGGVNRELVVVLASEVARTAVLKLDLGLLKEAEVLIGAVIDTANFLLALGVAFFELVVHVSLGIAGGAAAIGVLLTLSGAGAEAFVIVVLAVVAADGKVELGALRALLLDFLFSLSSVVDALAVSA